MSKITPRDRFPMEDCAVTSLPGSVRLIAWLLIVGGVLSVVLTVVNMLSGVVGIEVFGVVLALAGRGLLKRSSLWRTGVLAACWLVCCASGIAILVFTIEAFYAPEYAQQSADEFQLTVKQFWFLKSVVMGGFIFLIGWAYQVLASPEVRAIFTVAPIANEVSEPQRIHRKPWPQSVRVVARLLIIGSVTGFIVTQYRQYDVMLSGIISSFFLLVGGALLIRSRG